MMRLRLVAALVCLAALPLRAEEARLAMGEFQDFTRVVVEFTTRPAWSVETSDGAVRIDFAAVSPLTFAPERVGGTLRPFVAEFVQPDSLRLDLDCACAVDVTDFGARALVIEIRERQLFAEDASPSVSADPPALADVDVEEAVSAGRPAADDPVTVIRAAAALQGTDGGSWSDMAGTLWPFPSADRPPDLGAFAFPGLRSEAVDSLSRQLARAAAQGLVEPAEGFPAGNTDLGATLREEEGRGNISIVTGLDRDFLADGTAPVPNLEGALCLSDRDVDVTAWGDTGDPHHLGALRRQMVNEDGSIGPEGARDLARFYLALGFGAEAAALTDFISLPKDREILSAIAQIVDSGFTTSRVFHGQLQCEGFVGLWALLSGATGPASAPAHSDDILLAFSSLPAHLRDLLGAEVSERFRGLGLEEEARNALNAVTRGGATSEASELTAARLGLSGTTAETSRDLLTDLSRGTDTTSAEALLELFLDAERRKMAPNPQWVSDMPSLVRAMDGTEVAAQLNLAGMRGMIALGQFDAFRARVNGDTPGLDAESRGELASAALVAALDAETADFLEVEVLLESLISPASLAREEAYGVARRLLDLGLPGRAERFLIEPPVTATDLQTAAEIRAENGEAADAVALLKGAEEAGLQATLGRILAETGRIREAVDAFQSGGDGERATTLAMQLGDWDWVRSNGEAEMRDTTQGLLVPDGEASEVLGMENGRLLLSSRDLRIMSERLLDLTSAPLGGRSFTN